MTFSWSHSDVSESKTNPKPTFLVEHFVLQIKRDFIQFSQNKTKSRLHKHMMNFLTELNCVFTNVNFGWKRHIPEVEKNYCTVTRNVAC